MSRDPRILSISVRHPGWAERRNGEQPAIVAHIAYDGLRGDQVDVVPLDKDFALRLAEQAIHAVRVLSDVSQTERV